MGALLRDAAAHQQYEQREAGGDDGGEPEDVEVGEGGGLLVAGVLEELEGHVGGLSGVAGVLVEESLAAVEEVVDGGVEEVEFFVEAEDVELFAAFLDGLCDGCADGAAFVAKEREKADGGGSEVFGDVEEGGDVEGGEDHGEAHDEDDARPDDLPGRDGEVESGEPEVAEGEDEETGGHEVAGVDAEAEEAADDHEDDDGEEAGGGEDEAGGGGVVAEEGLEECGKRDGVGVEDGESAKDEDAAGAEVAVFEGAEIDEGVGDVEFADDERGEAADEEDGEGLDAVEGVAEPVPLLALGEEDFPGAHGDGEEGEAEGVEGLVVGAGLLAGFDDVGGISDDHVAHEEGEEADGDVEIEDPSPAVVVGDVTAEGGSDDGGEERGDAEDGLCGALFFGGEGVEEYALAGGLESAAGETLEDAAGDEHGEAEGHSAHGGGEGEDEDGEEEVVASAEVHGDPAGHGEDDGVGGEVGSDDPFGVGGGGGEAAGDVAEGDVGDGGVEDFHEGGDDDGGGDDPGVEGACLRLEEGGLWGEGGHVNGFSIFDFQFSIWKEVIPIEN